MLSWRSAQPGLTWHQLLVPSQVKWSRLQTAESECTAAVGLQGTKKRCLNWPDCQLQPQVSAVLPRTRLLQHAKCRTMRDLAQAAMSRRAWPRRAAEAGCRAAGLRSDGNKTRCQTQPRLLS